MNAAAEYGGRGRAHTGACPFSSEPPGWQYRHWRDVLYPADVPQKRWLEHYAERFATVENDGTFYRLPAGRPSQTGRHGRLTTS